MAKDTTTTAPVAPNVPPVVVAPDIAKAKKTPRYIAVTMNDALFAAIETGRGTLPAGTYLQRMIAEKLDVKIEAKASNRGKYAGMSAAEKKVAAKADKVKASRLQEMMFAKFADQMEALQAELEARMAKEATEAAAKVAA